MRTYTTVKRAYEGFTKKIMGTTFSSWRYIHKYFYFASERIRQICRPINHFILAAIIMSNKSWTAFEQSSRRKPIRLTLTLLRRPPSCPNCSRIRASNGRCFAELDGKIEMWKRGFQKEKRKKTSNSRQSWIKLKACQSSKACMGGTWPHAHLYLHNPADGCQSVQAVNMKDPYF